MRVNQLILIVAFILFCVNVNSCNLISGKKQGNNKEMENRNDDENRLKDSILDVNKASFIGMPVDSLLENKILGSYKEYIFIDEKPGLVSHLNLIYSKNLYLEIYVKRYDNMNPFDIHRDWDFDKFRREKIGELRLLYKEDCIETVK